MNLTDLLGGHDHHLVQGSADAVVTSVAYDSRKVRPGGLFLCVRGFTVDGHDYLDRAVAAGAVAVVIDRSPDELPVLAGLSDGVTVVRVADVRAVCGLVASRLHGEPAKALTTVAVTGTNGKTPIAAILENLLGRLSGQPAGVIGTGGPRLSGAALEFDATTPTTPEAVDLQGLLHQMRTQGAASVVMEASSMALHLHRVDACDLDVGIFTNLSPDHLDDHGTLEHYKQSKLLLFAGLCRQAVVNADDPVHAEIRALMPHAVTFGIDAQADYRASELSVNAAGTTFTLHHDGAAYAVRITTPGRFAVLNALAALATCRLLGHDLTASIDALAGQPATPGRFESFAAPGGASVIVDYAHSVDALENVLATIRGFATGRVITVFGCGGDRDPSKRAPMGEIVGKYTDLAVLTSDNPRTEDPELILDAIQAGIEPTGVEYVRLADRREAIAHALGVARAGDVVLIAGKGDEPYQEIGTVRHLFHDMTTVRELTAD